MYSVIDESTGESPFMLGLIIDAHQSATRAHNTMLPLNLKCAS